MSKKAKYTLAKIVLIGTEPALLSIPNVSIQTTVGIVLFAVGIAVGVVCLFSAIRQGQVCANGIIGISQGHDVQTNTMIYAAFPEFYAILALIAALMV